MKKRLFAIVLMVVLVMSLSMTALAAGVSSDEKAVFDHFCQVLNKHKANIGNNRNISQYIAEATNALNYVDLDAAACKDLDACVTAVDNYLTANAKDRISGFNSAIPVCNIINATSQKYGMTVSIDTYSTYATVTFGGNAVARPGSGIVKQTGINTTVTVVCLAAIAFVVAGVAGVALNRKNKVAVQ